MCSARSPALGTTRAGVCPTRVVNCPASLLSGTPPAPPGARSSRSPAAHATLRPTQSSLAQCREHALRAALAVVEHDLVRAPRAGAACGASTPEGTCTDTRHLRAEKCCTASAPTASCLRSTSSQRRTPPRVPPLEAGAAAPPCTGESVLCSGMAGPAACGPAVNAYTSARTVRYAGSAHNGRSASCARASTDGSCRRCAGEPPDGASALCGAGQRQ